MHDCETEGVIHLTSLDLILLYSGETLGAVKAAPINDKEEAEGEESGLNLSQGKRHAGFLSKSRLDHFLGEKRCPAFCRLWIDCDCLCHKGTGVQVMTVVMTDTTQQQLHSLLLHHLIWENRCHADRTIWLAPRFFWLGWRWGTWGGNLHTAFSWFWGENYLIPKRLIHCEPCLMKQKWIQNEHIDW